MDRPEKELTEAELHEELARARRDCSAWIHSYNVMAQELRETKERLDKLQHDIASAQFANRGLLEKVKAEGKAVEL